MREDPTPRQLFYETILPKIIIHEFYQRHIFQHDTIILNAEYSFYNGDENNLYDGARLKCGCEIFHKHIQQKKNEIEIELNHATSNTSIKKYNEFTTLLKKFAFIGGKN